jgi:alpha,alpha-trehalose phosphorylase
MCIRDSTYTNLLARENLWFAAETVRRMREENPDHYATLVHKTGFEPAEAEEWQRAADNMYVPFDEPTGIHPQDDTFLDQEVWDLENTPRDKFPLLLHYHPLVIYRHQVIKQADVVLALFLLGHEFSAERKKRNFDYYDPLTTGDSSLSACIQAIVAAEVGDTRKALKYARYAMLMDLADNGGNVRDGVHVASMGGSWMMMVYGLAGMRDYNGRISFDPRFPPPIQRLRFPLEIRGQRLEVEISQKSATYTLTKGAGLVITHQGKEIELSRGEPVSLPVRLTSFHA